MGVPLNTDLSTNFWVPIVAIQLQLSGLGGSLVSFTKRVIIWGHKTSAGTAQLNLPYQLVTQELTNQLFGPTSDVACQYAHLAAQNAAAGGAGVEAWAIVIAEPAGVASTRLIKIMALPTNANTPGTNTSAQAAGYADVYVGGWKFTANIANADSFGAIASAIATEITNRITAAQNPFNCPVKSATSGGTDTVTVVLNHIGVLGNDLALRVDFSSDAMKLAASCGTVIYTNAATANGSSTITVGSQSLVPALTNGDSVEVIIDRVVDVIEANPFNVRALDNHANVAGQVVLLYAQGRVAHRVVATVSAGATTVAVAAGTAGTGVPNASNLSDALKKLKAVPAFRLWLVPWTDTATLNTFVSHINEMQSGLNMKGQVVFICNSQDLITAGAIPTATSPKLTTTPRWGEGWCPDTEIRQCELMAHCAGAVLGDDYVAANYDGIELRTSGLVPLGIPHPAVRPDREVCNTAITTYHLTPIVVEDDGRFVIMRGTTTVSAATDELTNWGVIFGLDYARAFAVSKLKERFLKPRKNLKRHGAPQSDRTVNPESVKDCIGEILDDLEQGTSGAQADIVDGADELKKLIQYQSNPQVSGRVDATFPIRVPPPLHQISVAEQHLSG